MGFSFLSASLAAIFGRKPGKTPTKGSAKGPMKARAPAKGKTVVANGTASTSPYRAVSIVLGDAPCSAVHRFTRRRYLSSSAPPLPLPSCDSSACNCHFRRHKDRRAGPRRRTDIGVMSGQWAGQEKRRPGRGRRAEDRADAEDM